MKYNLINSKESIDIPDYVLERLMKSPNASFDNEIVVEKISKNFYSVRWENQTISELEIQFEI